jgi:hypothetical protein
VRALTSPGLTSEDRRELIDQPIVVSDISHGDSDAVLIPTDEQTPAQERLLDITSPVERHEQEVRHRRQGLEAELTQPGGQPPALLEGDIRLAS